MNDIDDVVGASESAVGVVESQNSIHHHKKHGFVSAVASFQNLWT